MQSVDPEIMRMLSEGMMDGMKKDTKDCINLDSFRLNLLGVSFVQPLH